MTYIYEYIRTRGTQPLHFEEHYNRLEKLSRDLFLTTLPISCEELYKEIVKQLRAEGYSTTATNAVCVKFYPLSKEVDISIEEIIYDSFALRAIRPEGYLSPSSGEYITKKSSVRYALLEFNRSVAQISDAGVAIWATEEGEIIAIDGASAVAVFEDEIRFSNYGCDLEFETAFEKLSATTNKVTRGSIYVEELHKAKELLGIDYRGVLAVESFDSHIFMDITAEKIATKMAETME